MHAEDWGAAAQSAIATVGRVPVSRWRRGKMLVRAAARRFGGRSGDGGKRLGLNKRPQAIGASLEPNREWESPWILRHSNRRQIRSLKPTQKRRPRALCSMGVGYPARGDSRGYFPEPWTFWLQAEQTWSFAPTMEPPPRTSPAPISSLLLLLQVAGHRPRASPTLATSLERPPQSKRGA